MVLTSGSVFESECPTPLVRKIKIRQKLAEATPAGRSRSTSLSGSRAGSTKRASAVAPTSRMADSSTRTSTNGSSRLPMHPKLRRILVASQPGQGQGGVGSPVSSRSRNSPPERCEKASSGGAPQAAAARKKSARAKDVLTALSVASGGHSSSSRQRRARTPSPVLAHSDRRGLLPEHHQPAIPKSASVPADLAGRAPGPQAQGILKRSTSFLAGLEPRGLYSLLRRRPRAAGSPQRSSPDSSHRKCVSFSADTSFAERQRDTECLGKTAVHEAKVYRKGVLQDRNGCEDKVTNLPLSWEESLGGPKALLGAAQDGDDDLIKKIVTLANKAGLGNIDVNAVDSSGRTAISYMAGNGSALMLEACLSFHGVDANLPDNEGNTPLHFAAQAGQTECLNILLQRCPSIEVDARNSLGFTPLMKAALQGRTKCAKILLFAGANPTLRDHGRGLRAEQWARFCGRYVCAEVIERFARHRLLEKTTSCRWGSEPELATQILQGKLMPIPTTPVQPPSSGLKSKIRRVFRTSSSSDKNFSLVSQLTSAALCASSPVLPKPGDVSPVVKSLLRPLSVPQLRITLVTPQDIIEKTSEKCSHSTSFTEKIEGSIVKPPRTKKKSK